VQPQGGVVFVGAVEQVVVLMVVQLAMTLSLADEAGAVKLVICGCVDTGVHTGTLDGGSGQVV
jgi:hypothetical protein